MAKKVKLLMMIAFALVATSHAWAQDLKAEVNQTAFDEVLNSVKYPLTLVEHNDPFKSMAQPIDRGNVIMNDDLVTKAFPQQLSADYFKWAVDGVSTTVRASASTDADNVYKQALQEAWNTALNDIQKIIEDAERLSTQSNGRAMDVGEYSIEELKKVQGMKVDEAIAFFNSKSAGAFALKAHLPYARVNLNTRPTLKVISPTFKIANIKVEVTATGELWAKLPEIRCCRYVLGICVCVRVDWKWKRIASVTVSPDLDADMQATFSESILKVVGKAKFDRLRLDYPILREIPLEPIANHYMAGKQFEVYDASKFMMSLPYIGSTFVIESLAIPKNPNGVTIEVNIKQ